VTWPDVRLGNEPGFRLLKILSRHLKSSTPSIDNGYVRSHHVPNTFMAWHVWMTDARPMEEVELDALSRR
jgi:hypothetical protein